ncbi:MAG TPA: hypothetical protein VGJ00_05570 [Rhabdochlamydiaceae bacterium]|jgi:hypothetical protein
MKINQKVLSIPPYISTSWENILALHVEHHNALLFLIVTLSTGARIEIPGLTPTLIKMIFGTHARFLEQETLTKHEEVISFGFALQPEPTAGGLETVAPLLQHNPEQRDTPELPAEFLKKIASLAKTLGVKDPSIIPQPEPDCNCMHCQIAKAMKSGVEDDSESFKEEHEEIVSDEELKFRSWDIHQMGDKLYSVCNPIDSQEHYNVYLGEPVGCTCGNPHCEHIRAVLNS